MNDLTPWHIEALKRLSKSASVYYLDLADTNSMALALAFKLQQDGYATFGIQSGHMEITPKGREVLEKLK